MMNPVSYQLQVFSITIDSQEIFCSYYKNDIENVWTINLPREVIELSLDVDARGKTMWLLNGMSNNVSITLGKAIEESHRRRW